MDRSHFSQAPAQPARFTGSILLKIFPYFRLGTDANSFFEDDNGNLWLVTTDDGLIRNNKSGGKRIFPGAGDAAGIISESVNVVRPARGGDYGLVPFKGLKDSLIPVPYFHQVST